MKNATAGRGFLRFEKICGKTVVTESFAKSPLKILAPKNHGNASWVYSSNYDGGYVGGDNIDIDIDVAAEARAVFLGQSSTKVYRSVDESRQTVRGTIASGGILFSLPDPVVCFAGSKFSQRQSYELNGNASLLLLDAFHSGREHSGERWTFDSYKNRIQVSRNEKKIFYESLLLHPLMGAISERQSRFNCFSLILMTGPAFQKNAHELHKVMSTRPPSNREDFIYAASLLGDDGLVIRMAAVKTEILADATKELLHFLPGLLGDDPWSRKW